MATSKFQINKTIRPDEKDDVMDMHVTMEPAQVPGDIEEAPAGSSRPVSASSGLPGSIPVEEASAGPARPASASSRLPGAAPVESTKPKEPQAGPSGRATREAREPAAKRSRHSSNTDEESATSGRMPKFRVPPKPEGFENAFQLVRALEKQKKVLFSIRLSRDGGMIISPKDQSTLRFLQETKKLPDGRGVNLAVVTPQDRNQKMVLLGFPVSYGMDVTMSHPQVIGASRLQKREDSDQATPGHHDGSSC